MSETTRKKKFWIFAGEASGDLYGARLANELKHIAAERGEEISIAAMGGPRMQETDVEIMVDSTELGVVGLIEVLKHIFVFIKLFISLVKRAEKERPDAVILIDYPGFNIRFAKQMYKRGIPVIWYISPHIWSWGGHRLPKLAKWCDKMMLIFPFEIDVYKGSGLDTVFVGHPLVDVVKERLDPELVRDENTVLLLPGSRFMEVDRLLEPMFETARMLYSRNSNLKFVLAAPRQKIYDRCRHIYDEVNRADPDYPLPNIEFVCGNTGKWLQKATIGLAASGTITVEAAVSGLPLVVLYKLNAVTVFLARMAITLFRGFFTMVNIIANRTVYEEFMQEEVCPEVIAAAAWKILPGGDRREEVLEGIDFVTKTISGGSEGASANAAQVCYDFVCEKRREQQ